MGEGLPRERPQKGSHGGTGSKPQGYKLGGSTPNSPPHGLSHDSSPVEHRIGGRTQGAVVLERRSVLVLREHQQPEEGIRPQLLCCRFGSK